MLLTSPGLNFNETKGVAIILQRLFVILVVVVKLPTGVVGDAFLQKVATLIRQLDIIVEVL